MGKKRTGLIFLATTAGLVVVCAIGLVLSTAKRVEKCGIKNLPTQTWLAEDSNSASRLAAEIVQDGVRMEVVARAKELCPELEYSAEDVAIRAVHDEGSVFITASFAPLATRRYSLWQGTPAQEFDQESGTAGKYNRTMQQAVQEVVDMRCRKFGAVRRVQPG